MSANTIITSVVTAGTNNHTTTAEEANALASDFVTQGVLGAITLNAGSGGTGSFCVNQNTGSNMAINILAGQAYITATPSSQDSQVLRARASSDYTAYTINSNSSGSTKYDWIYLQVNATNANNPAADASDVTSIFTSRSSSNTVDNGTPPIYGLLLGYVTVANGATAITNANITDKRFNTSIGAQNGSLIVTQSGTGVDAKIQAAGVDSNVNLDIMPKGTGSVILPTSTTTNFAGKLGMTPVTSNQSNTATSPTVVSGFATAVNIPAGGREVKITFSAILTQSSASNQVVISLWDGVVGSGTQVGQGNTPPNSINSTLTFVAVVAPSAGAHTYNIGMNGSGAGTNTIIASSGFPAILLVEGN